jgi:peptide/nickel transport system substrate-binding protein
VEDVALTYTKNPDYWGFDEKFPDNRLPYVDEFRGVIMPDESTRLAALRSGQLDVLGGPAAYALSPGPSTEGLARTNAELKQFAYQNRSQNSAAFNLKAPPFDDVRVRRAIQMALDLETVAATYFKGYADPTPRGVVGIANTGYAFPVAEWSDELKGYYSYDPAGAEALLDEAGYPRGADGVRFQTIFNAHPSPAATDQGFVAIMIQFWDAIGVDVDLLVADGAAFGPMIQNADYEGILWFITGWNRPLPVTTIGWQATGAYNNATGHSVEEYDAMIAAVGAATTVEEERQLILEADRYLIENHLYLWGPIMPQVAVTQPWIVGYNGENNLGDVDSYTIFARLWIDHQMKESMGH